MSPWGLCKFYSEALVLWSSEIFKYIPYIKIPLQNIYNGNEQKQHHQAKQRKNKNKQIKPQTSKKSSRILPKLFSCLQGSILDFSPLPIIYFLSLEFCILNHKAKLCYDSWDLDLLH